MFCNLPDTCICDEDVIKTIHIHLLHCKGFNQMTANLCNQIYVLSPLVFCELYYK